MSYDYELTLVAPGGFIEDEIGNQIPVDPIKTPVLCKMKSIGRNEFYNAANTGLRPELVFVIHAYEYNGEPIVNYEGKDYRVIRTYSVSFEGMELIVQKVAADG